MFVAYCVLDVVCCYALCAVRCSVLVVYCALCDTRCVMFVGCCVVCRCVLFVVWFCLPVAVC